MHDYTITFATLNCLDYTRTCLDSLWQAGVPEERVVVVDNASSDGTVDYLRASGLPHVVFNRENRLIRLGDLVAAGATLHHIALGASSEALMRGNATHGDVTDPCPICFEDGTDLELPKCHHRMHSICLGKCLMMTAVCPLCRAHITA